MRRPSARLHGGSLRLHGAVPPGRATIADADQLAPIGQSYAGAPHDRGPDRPVDSAGWHLDLLRWSCPPTTRKRASNAGLDELFAYLDGDAARSDLPADVRVLVVDDGSTDGTAAIVHHRREAAAREAACRRVSSSCRCHTPGKALPCAPGCSPRTRTSSPSPTRTWRRRRTSSRCSWPRCVTTTSRWAAGSSPTGPTCVPRSRRSVACSVASSTRWRRPGWRAQCRTRSAASRGSPGPPRRTCSAASGSRASRSTSRSSTSPAKQRYRIAIVPVRWTDRRGSRMHPRLGLAMRVAWDLFRIPFLHRHERVSRPQAS